MVWCCHEVFIQQGRCDASSSFKLIKKTPNRLQTLWSRGGSWCRGFEHSMESMICLGFDDFIQRIICLVQVLKYNTSGGSKGDARDTPPGGPNSFNFMRFLWIFGKIVCWRPPPESWRPLLGEILDRPLHSIDQSTPKLMWVWKYQTHLFRIADLSFLQFKSQFFIIFRFTSCWQLSVNSKAQNYLESAVFVLIHLLRKFKLRSKNKEIQHFFVVHPGEQGNYAPNSPVQIGQEKDCHQRGP